MDVILNRIFETIYNNIFKAINQVFDGLFDENIYNRNELDIIIM